MNSYMAQSTLAYQKEIMRLRSIIQATAPDRLRTPPAAGGGGGGGGGGGVERPSKSGGNPRNSSPAVDAWAPRVNDGDGGGQRLGAGGIR